MNTKLDISVIILGYRSGAFLKEFHSKVVSILEKMNLNYEIILVGNYHSKHTDVTPEVASTLAQNHTYTKAVVKKKTNSTQAMGWDMKSGFDISKADTLCVIDGDGQMPPGDIPLLYKKLKEENLDLCKARRVSREDGTYRKFISFLFNRIMSLLFPGIISTDINGKPKIFTREAFNKLQLESDDWFIDSEIMIKARRFKFKIGEIKTSFYLNPETTSSVSFTTNSEFLKNILIWRLKETKLWMKR